MLNVKAILGILYAADNLSIIDELAAKNIIITAIIREIVMKM